MTNISENVWTSLPKTKHQRDKPKTVKAFRRKQTFVHDRGEMTSAKACGAQERT